MKLDDFLIQLVKYCIREKERRIDIYIYIILFLVIKVLKRCVVVDFVYIKLA